MDETTPKRIKSEQNNLSENKKKKYISPEIITEELLAFGAVCNGTSNGGRKDSTGAPQFCNATRIFS